MAATTHTSYVRAEDGIREPIEAGVRQCASQKRYFITHGGERPVIRTVRLETRSTGDATAPTVAEPRPQTGRDGAKRPVVSANALTNVVPRLVRAAVHRADRASR